MRLALGGETPRENAAADGPGVAYANLDRGTPDWPAVAR